MDNFLITAATVGMMLLYAMPGFFLTKTKAVSPGHISSFAKLLLYVCNPCLTVYSLQKVTFSWQLLGEMGIVFLIASVQFAVMLPLARFLFGKFGGHDVKMRICSVATCFGNCSFLGIPLLEALLPNYPQAATFSVVYGFVMNVFGWTMASAMIADNKKYMSFRKILLNPATFGMAGALVLFFAGITLPGQLNDAVTLLGRMSTPLCMLIIGMRLGAVPLRPIFTVRAQYLTIGFKQIIFPLVCFGIMYALPIPAPMRTTVYIMCCMPVAAVVLTFSELLGEGQDTAANLVLLGTLLSLATVPVLMLLI